MWFVLTHESNDGDICIFGSPTRAAARQIASRRGYVGYTLTPAPSRTAYVIVVDGAIVDCCATHEAADVVIAATSAPLLLYMAIVRSNGAVWRYGAYEYAGAF